MDGCRLATALELRRSTNRAAGSQVRSAAPVPQQRMATIGSDDFRRFGSLGALFVQVVLPWRPDSGRSPGENDRGCVKTIA
jgi:hypothetical protein